MKKTIVSLAVVTSVVGLGVIGSVVAHPGHGNYPSETDTVTGTYLQPAVGSTDQRLQPAAGIGAQGGTELNQLPNAVLR